MLEHIVKNGERIEDILSMYHLQLEEIVSINLHVTDFYHLVSGTKIKIPLLTEEVEQILDNTESFIQRYYPKMEDLEEPAPIQEVVLERSPKEDVLTEPIQLEPKKEALGRPYPGILPPKNPYKRS